MKTDGGGGGKRVVEMEGRGGALVVILSLRVLVVLYGRPGVIVVPGVSELG